MVFGSVEGKPLKCLPPVLHRLDGVSPFATSPLSVSRPKRNCLKKKIS